MWPNPHETAYLVTFTEEILNGKLYFLCNPFWIYEQNADWISEKCSYDTDTVEHLKSSALL